MRLFILPGRRVACGGFLGSVTGCGEPTHSHARFLSRGEKGSLSCHYQDSKLLVPAAVWKKSLIELAMGSGNRIDGCLCEQLVELGYRRENMVATPGEFALRGSIVDIYPLDQEYPLRLISLIQKWISIRAFNAETQRSMDVIQEVRILPPQTYPLKRKLSEGASQNPRAL